jgi:hypothetical protein
MKSQFYETYKSISPTHPTRSAKLWQDDLGPINFEDSFGLSGKMRDLEADNAVLRSNVTEMRREMEKAMASV